MLHPAFLFFLKKNCSKGNLEMGKVKTRTLEMHKGAAPRNRSAEIGPATRSSFTLARLRRHREAFLNPRLPERCLAGDGPGRLIAVEVEA
jgi:hypothetical protein